MIIKIYIIANLYEASKKTFIVGVHSKNVSKYEQEIPQLVQPLYHEEETQNDYSHITPKRQLKKSNTFS